MTQMTKKRAKYEKTKKGMIELILKRLNDINHWSYENHNLLRKILARIKNE